MLYRNLEIFYGSVIKLETIGIDLCIEILGVELYINLVMLEGVLSKKLEMIV